MRVEKSVRSNPHEALRGTSGGSWPPKNLIRRNRAKKYRAVAYPGHYSDKFLVKI